MTYDIGRPVRADDLSGEEKVLLKLIGDGSAPDLRKAQGYGYIALFNLWLIECQEEEIFLTALGKKVLEDLKAEKPPAAEVSAMPPDVLSALQAAESALRSYQFGNAAPDLAQEIADLCCKAIRAAGAEPLLTRLSEGSSP